MSDPHILERRLLLAALHPRERAVDPTAAASAERFDWSWLLDRAVEQKVAPLLAWRLDESGIAEALPRNIHARLTAAKRAARGRAMQAARTLQQIAAVLNSAAIPFLVIKGSILSELVYGDAAIRPFNDVDIVVKRDTVSAAEAALAAVGYTFIPPTAHQLETFGIHIDAGVGVPESVGRAFYADRHFHFQLAPPAADRLTVEIHWQLARPGLLRERVSPVWTQTSGVTVAGTRVACLNGEAMIVHAASHAVNHGHSEFRLLHLADVAWLLERSPLTWRTDRVWELASDWGATADVSSALILLENLLGYRHPELRPLAGLGDRFRRAMLDRVADANALIDRTAPTRGAPRLLHDLFAEGAWELCEGRMPGRAGLRATSAVRIKVNGLRAALRTPRPALRTPRPATNEKASHRTALPANLAALFPDMAGRVADAVDRRADGQPSAGSFLIQSASGERMKTRLLPTAAEAERLAELTAHLSDNDPFPRVIARSGNALLLEWIEGEAFAAQKRDRAAFRRVGALLAQLHSLDSSSLPVRTQAVAEVRDRLQLAMDGLVVAGALTPTAAQQTARLALEHTPSSVEVGCTYADFRAERILVDWADRLYLSNVGRIVADFLDYDLTVIEQRWPMSAGEREAFFDGYGEHRSLHAFKKHRFFWTILARAEAQLVRTSGHD